MGFDALAESLILKYNENAPSADVLVVGGGFAGLSAAASLAENGIKVILLEKKPHLGGRAYSFFDRPTGAAIDNGQHLFLGAYLETRKFLSRIGSAPLLQFSKSLLCDFRDQDQCPNRLSAPPFLNPPLNFAWAIARLKRVSIKEKMLAGRVFREVKKWNRDPSLEAKLDALTVREWLDSLKQSSNLQQRLWDPLAIGILNESPEIASALGLVQALGKILLTGGKDAANLGLSTVALSELYVEQGRSYLEKAGGKVYFSSKADALVKGEGGILGLQCADKKIYLSKTVLLALPPWEIARLNWPELSVIDWKKFKAAPIIGLSLFLDRPIMEENLCGLINTRFQWVFNKSRLLNLTGSGQYLSLVISAAHRELLWEPKKFLDIAVQELRAFPDFEKAKIIHWRLIKEPYATLSPTPGMEAARPEPGFIAPGICLAGDWTRTGLPATIESAVLSGHKAARILLNAIKA